MLNIGFKEMAKCSLAGIAGIMIPAVILSWITGMYLVSLVLVIYACGGGFLFASLWGMSILKDKEDHNDTLRMNLVNSEAENVHLSNQCKLLESMLDIKDKALLFLTRELIGRKATVARLYRTMHPAPLLPARDAKGRFVKHV